MKMSDLVAQPQIRFRTSINDKYGIPIISCESEWHMNQVEKIITLHDELVEALGMSIDKLNQCNFNSDNDYLVDTIDELTELLQKAKS